MHLTSTVKSIVFTVAFATQYVYAKSQNGHAYFNEKFCVLEWIIYLKRLSLIALILCGVVLYYVPKSRSYARIVCCILIDTVANGLKFALNTDGIEHEKITARDENDENKELRIQELYRKVYEKDTGNYGQKYNNKMNFDNGNHKSIRRHQSKKYCTKHNDGKRHRHNRYRNAINNVLPESDVLSESTVMMSTINNPQITVIDEKCEKDTVVIPQNTFPEMKILTMSDKLKNNIDLRQKNSWNKKIDSSSVSEIIDKNDTNYKLIKFKQDLVSQKQEDISDIDADKKLQNRQNFGYLKHEQVTIASRHQLSKDYPKKIMNEQMDSHRDRIKPVLLRVVNWLFGGCPEASKRHRHLEQIHEVGKEEIFKSTNMWLAETSELYLQQ